MNKHEAAVRIALIRACARVLCVLLFVLAAILADASQLGFLQALVQLRGSEG